MSFLEYVVAEVTRGYLLEEDDQNLLSEKQRRVSRFMKTPRELEMVWGGVECVHICLSRSTLCLLELKEEVWS